MIFLLVILLVHLLYKTTSMIFLLFIFYVKFLYSLCSTIFLVATNIYMLYASLLVISVIQLQRVKTSPTVGTLPLYP